jgi:hypothetical protein
MGSAWRRRVSLDSLLMNGPKVLTKSTTVVELDGHRDPDAGLSGRQPTGSDDFSEPDAVALRFVLAVPLVQALLA